MTLVLSTVYRSRTPYLKVNNVLPVSQAIHLHLELQHPLPRRRIIAHEPVRRLWCRLFHRLRLACRSDI